MITVLSRRGDPDWTPGERDGVLSVYVGRPEALGNPFRLVRTHSSIEANRRKIVGRYEAWLMRAVLLDPVVSHEFKKIEAAALAGLDIELVCWCAPKACHADVIRKFLEASLARRDRDLADSN
jgi:hypothetical protein